MPNWDQRHQLRHYLLVGKMSSTLQVTDIDALSALVEQFAAFPRQGSFDDKRDLILREAARLFVEQGVRGTSLDTIAARFEISKPALYHYARSKDDIIALILQKAGERRREHFEQLNLSRASGKDKVRAALTEYGSGIASEFGRCLATIQPGTFSPDTLQLHRQTHRMLLEGVAAFIEEGIADGSLRPCTPKLRALAIFGALNSMVRWIRHDGSMSHDQVVSEIIDAFMCGMTTD